jgi:hypothetical protein
MADPELVTQIACSAGGKTSFIQQTNRRGE